MASRGLAATELIPQEEEDTFRVLIRVDRFHRDDAGRLMHLTLDASRVQGMRHSREPAARRELRCAPTTDLFGRHAW